MKVNAKDLGSGIFFLAVGLFYLGYTLFGYSLFGFRMNALPIGRAFQMGPGFFPVMLSSAVALLGAAIMIKSVVGADHARIEQMPWRAIVMITLAICVFGFVVRDLGLALTVFVTSMLACLSSEQIKMRTSLIVSAGMAVFCVIIFSYGVKLSIPIFGAWVENFFALFGVRI